MTTVYVILNADGTQQKIYVSDWLKNQGEKDSYTQSNPDKDAPISLKVTYTLDGKEISPSDLNGQSGHVVIRYDYTNELYETREIAGMLGIPENTVKTRLRAAREHLRKDLKGACFA